MAQDRQPPKARVQYRWRFLHRHGRVYRGGLTCSHARYQWLAELRFTDRAAEDQ